MWEDLKQTGITENQKNDRWSRTTKILKRNQSPQDGQGLYQKREGRHQLMSSIDSGRISKPEDIKGLNIEIRLVVNALSMRLNLITKWKD